jgi:outer membrane protein insertion porin family
MKPPEPGQRRTDMGCWPAVLLVTAAMNLPAQPAFPLQALRIEGNQRIAAGKILAVAGLNIGQPVVKTDFDSARNRLLASGAFESVAYEFKPSADNMGYDGVFRVVEVSQLYPYRFEDLPAPEDALRGALRKQEPLLGDQIPATREVLDRYEKATEQFLKGEVKVVGKLSADVPGQLMIVFRSASARPNIAEVHFTGNDVLPSTLLMNTISGVAIGVPYSEAGLRVLLDLSIRPLYEARGRIRVSFPQITVEPSKKIDGIVVTVAVNEGESYNLGTTKITGVPSGKAAELRDLAKWKGNDIANFDEIKAGLERIYQAYRHDGYLHVTARVDRDVHDAEHTVDLQVTMDPGPQFTLGKLDIMGLDIMSEPAIRKMWGIQVGRPFDPAYPDAFLKEIRDQDLFDNLGKTRAETQVHEQSKTADVTLYFSGAAADEKKAREKRP